MKSATSGELGRCAGAGTGGRILLGRGEDLPVGGPGVGAGLDAQLRHQPPAQPLEHRERLGLAPGSVQRQHQLPVEALPQRVFGDQRGQLADQGAVPAVAQIGLQPPLQDLEPRLPPLLQLRFQPGRRGFGQRDAGQRIAAPQGEGGAGAAADGRPVAPAAGGVRRADQAGEDQRVHLLLPGLDPVAGRVRAQPGRALLAEGAAQPGHMVVDGGGRARGRVLAPERGLHGVQ